MNTMVVSNHIFQASKNKLQKYKRSHDNARANGSHSNSTIVPFAVGTLGNFCLVAITVLKAVAKIKFAKISNKAEVKELAASNRISTTNVRVEIYKPRLLKLAPIIIVLL